jgi:hypothetical protein
MNRESKCLSTELCICCDLERAIHDSTRGRQPHVVHGDVHGYLGHPCLSAQLHVSLLHLLLSLRQSLIYWFKYRVHIKNTHCREYMQS